MKNEVKIDMRDIQKYIDGYIEYQNLINWIFDNDFRCELHDSNNADKSFIFLTFLPPYNRGGEIIFNPSYVGNCFFIVRKPHVSQKKGDQQQYWELLRILIFHHQAKRGILQFFCQAVQTCRK